MSQVSVKNRFSSHNIVRTLPLHRVHAVGCTDDDAQYPKGVQEIADLLEEMSESSRIEKEKVINFKDWDGSTALHAAAKAGAFEVVRYLMRSKADLTLKNHIGHTALHAAMTKKGNID
eukprot:1371744-Amorphochlora_amoeboformis.AAC.1